MSLTHLPLGTYAQRAIPLEAKVVQSVVGLLSVLRAVRAVRAVWAAGSDWPRTTSSASRWAPRPPLASPAALGDAVPVPLHPCQQGPSPKTAHGGVLGVPLQGCNLEPSRFRTRRSPCTRTVAEDAFSEAATFFCTLPPRQQRGEGRASRGAVNGFRLYLVVSRDRAAGGGARGDTRNEVTHSHCNCRCDQPALLQNARRRRKGRRVLNCVRGDRNQRHQPNLWG